MKIRRSSGCNELHFGAFRLVLRELEGLYRVAQRKLPREQRPDVDPVRGDVLDRPVELDAPAERAFEVELFDHDLVDDEGQRLVRQRADLNDRAAAFRGGDAGLERGEAAGRLEGDVELWRRQRLRLAVGAEGARGTNLARRFQRPIQHVGHAHHRCASEPRRDNGEATYGAPARDEYVLAEQIAGAVDRVQANRKWLGECQLSQAHVAGHRVALPLAQDEILGEHALHVRVEARAAEEAHVAAQMLAPFAAIVAAPTGLRRTHRDLVAGLDARDALADLRDDARSLVSGNERLADDEASIPAFEVIVQIGAADAARAEPDQHLARSDLGFRLWLYAQVFLRVNTASQHDRSLLVTALVQRQCFASQLLLKR